MSVEITPKEGFDWQRITWGRPDSPLSVLCSYCSASIGDEDVPLRIWNDKGFAAQFCDTCQEKCFGFELGIGSKVTLHRKCRVCGCTDDDCRQCIERTGKPCSWVEPDLCSACRR